MSSTEGEVSFEREFGRERPASGPRGLGSCSRALDRIHSARRHPLGEPIDQERELGPQPILDVLARHGLSATDLVEASAEQLTHKMVARAVKGRRLTANTMGKVVRALNRRAESDYTPAELFNYVPSRRAEREEGG